MTFTDWQTSADIDYALDWSSATAMNGHPPGPVMEALRQALVERCTVVDKSVPAVLQSAPTNGQRLDADIPTWFDDFDDTITALIPYFVNYTDNAGDWDGQATCAPAWSEADILADIGDAERVTFWPGDMGTWAKQQYDILHRLLWIASNAAGLPSGYVTGYIGARQPTNNKIIYTGSLACVDYIIGAVNALAFGYGYSCSDCGDIVQQPEIWTPQEYGGHTFFNPYGTDFRPAIWFDSFALEYGAVAYDYEVLYKVYLPSSGWTDKLFTGSFWPSAVDGLFQRKTSGSISPVNVSVPVSSLDNHDFQNWLVQAPTGTFATFRLADETVLLKFNVPGGFTFQ